MPATSAIHRLLKARTDPSHRRLEKQVAGILLGPDLTPELYCRLLSAFLRVYQPLEARVAQFAGPARLLAGRSKVPFLREELRTLAPAGGGSPRPSPGRAPLIGCESAAWGAMYVMEGATLGGQHIARRLLRHPWLGSGAAAGFFNPYRDQVFGYWQEFLENLASHAGTSSAQSEKMTEAAIGVFDSVEAELREEFRHG